MEHRVFRQGERVMWRDGSGERQRGRVMQHSRAAVGADGTEREEVIVMREGTSDVTALPPSALVLAER